MIPEPSTLNWSNKKPTYDEVRGKLIVFEWARFGGKKISSDTIDNPNTYDIIFDDSFTRYAIIADQPEPEPEPEPMEYKGVIPSVSQYNSLIYGWLVSWDNEIGERHSFDGQNKIEAISKWNEFVLRLKN